MEFKKGEKILLPGMSISEAKTLPVDMNLEEMIDSLTPIDAAYSNFKEKNFKKEGNTWIISNEKTERVNG